MKRPSFQFYPSDWLRDTALRTCSTGARGLWIDMICYMHEGSPYGYLKVKNKIIDAKNLAKMVGETTKNVKQYLEELHEAGVYDLDDDGAICSRRMIKDENTRNSRASGGKLGGNPNLINAKKDINKDNLEDNLEDNLKDKQKTTPSSSSSSSSSLNIKPILSESKIPPCPHQSVIDLYHQILPELPRVEIWNKKREGLLKQRWRELFVDQGCKDSNEALEWFRDEYFPYIKKSAFLTGKVHSKDRKPFVATLEWVISPSHFANIVEGKYHK